MTAHDPTEILLVEDNRADEDLTLHALSSSKLANSVTVVRDGQAALDFLFGEGGFAARNGGPHPRIVLLDLKLPKLDGLQVLRIVKSDPRTRTVPVIVLTSSREERDIIESYELGVNSYIQKPVDFEQFAAAMRLIGAYWLVYNQAPYVGRAPGGQASS